MDGGLHRINIVIQIERDMKAGATQSLAAEQISRRISIRLEAFIGINPLVGGQHQFSAVSAQTNHGAFAGDWSGFCYQLDTAYFHPL